jgi:hypothetical protein
MRVHVCFVFSLFYITLFYVSLVCGTFHVRECGVTVELHPQQLQVSGRNKVKVVRLLALLLFERLHTEYSSEGKTGSCDAGTPIYFEHFQGLVVHLGRFGAQNLHSRVAGVEQLLGAL